MILSIYRKERTKAMMRIHLTPVEKRPESKVARITLRSAAILLFLICLSVTVASAQSDYSDIWIDDSQAEEGIAYVIGTGVTDTAYDSEAVVNVETSITSPNGRRATAISDGDRAEAALVWDFTDVGLFFVQSLHRRYCPKTFGYYESYDPYNLCFLNRLTYVQRTFATGEPTTLDYRTIGPVSPRDCGYDLCPYEEVKPCYKWHRRNYLYPKKEFSTMLGGPDLEKTESRYLKTSHVLNLGAANHNAIESPCWGYLRVHYMGIRDPWLNTLVLCVRYFRHPTDYPPAGNPCAQ
jgi:hypothetical protein